MIRRSLVVGAALAVLTLASYRSGLAQVAWGRVLSFIAVQGEPVAASPAVLSDHLIAQLDGMTQQQQAEMLLGWAVHGYQGATERIAASVDSWRGKMKLDEKFETQFRSALNSNDLRVRAAAIEVNLAALNVEKNAASVDSRIRSLEAGEGDRVWALWILGLLGNRGVEPDRVFPVLLKHTRDSDEGIRYWAVEGLAYLGTDATIEPLLDIFRNDPSPAIRERAACGLAQSGMLQQAQRMRAVPAFLNHLDDATLDPTMRQWTLQALQDISGQRLGADPAAWRQWYNNRRP
jgi:HEAT repeats